MDRLTFEAFIGTYPEAGEKGEAGLPLHTVDTLRLPGTRRRRERADHRSVDIRLKPLAASLGTPDMQTGLGRLTLARLGLPKKTQSEPQKNATERGTANTILQNASPTVQNSNPRKHQQNKILLNNQALQLKGK